MEGLGLLINKGSQRGEDPVTIYTLISELQRECDTWKRKCKSLEDQAMGKEKRCQQLQEEVAAL
jgi:chaperonin cofactor prefoldin